MELPWPTEAVVTFHHAPGMSTFTTLNRAMAWVKAQGWSYGSLQRGAPIGIAREDDAIVSKWRSLGDDRNNMCGAIISMDPNGSYRDADVQVRMRTGRWP